MGKLSDANKARIFALHVSDQKYYTVATLARLYRCSPGTIRDVLDPEGRAYRLAQKRGRRNTIPRRETMATKRAAHLPGVSYRPISDHDLRQLRNSMPKYDERDLTGRFCGDPAPGRSALDRLVKKKDQYASF